MQGAYGGLIVVIAYGMARNNNNVTELFLWLDNTPFTLLSGEQLLLL